MLLVAIVTIRWSGFTFWWLTWKGRLTRCTHTQKKGSQRFVLLRKCLATIKIMESTSVVNSWSEQTVNTQWSPLFNASWGPTQVNSELRGKHCCVCGYGSFVLWVSCWFYVCEGAAVKQTIDITAAVWQRSSCSTLVYFLIYICKTFSESAGSEFFWVDLVMMYSHSMTVSLR